jgi:hypothetical protein
VTIRRLELSGAAVGDGNGAGIRYEGGNLLLQRSYVHDNQDGILGNAVAGGTIRVGYSEFAKNGACDGYTHGIYANQISLLRIQYSYFHDTCLGHHIKSRAASTIVRNNRLVDGAIPAGASYSIDVPNGGVTNIVANQIEQDPDEQNPNLIAYGEEGNNYPGASTLVVRGNLLQNLAPLSGTGVWNSTGVIASVTDNRVYSLATSISTVSPWQK